MRKAERLFQIATLLKSRHTALTAKHLSESLGVSERTIYRDIQSLTISGIPVEGQAGIGYRIKPGYNLPSLMFSTEELEALWLGAKMVQAWTDRHLAAAANLAIAKITSILPEHLKAKAEKQAIFAPNFHIDSKTAEYIGIIRQAIKQHYILNIHYIRVDGERSVRDIRPLGLFYWGRVWTLVGWCQLRNDFRGFRPDRIETLELTNQVFKTEPGKTLDDYLKQACQHEYKQATL